MEAETNAGVFDTPPNELARILALFAGKGGAGNPPFEKIDLKISPGPPGRVSVSTDHTNAAKNLGIRAVWTGAVGDGAAFETATNEPIKLIDYLAGGGFFVADRPVRLSYHGDGPEAGRILLSQGSRYASVPTSPVSGVPRQPLADTFVEGPEGVFVSSDPKLPRPAPKSGWLEWTKAGYVVLSIPTTEIAAILSAAGTLFRHGSKGALIRFVIDANGVEIVCSDPKDPKAEVARIDHLDGAISETGSPDDTFAVLYSAVEPIWSALSSTKAPAITLVRLPSARRVNLIAVEKDEAGTPTLLATITFAIWSDPRTRKTVPASVAKAGSRTATLSTPPASFVPTPVPPVPAEPAEPETV